MGYINIIQLLVDHMADAHTFINSDNSSVCAVHQNHDMNQSAQLTTVCKDVGNVLKHVVDIYDKNFDSMTATDMASYNGHIHVVDFLTSRNRSTIEMRRSTLYTIPQNRTDVEDIDGLRPIQHAVRTGNVELVKLLIQYGANVDAADPHGNRPLHEAVCHGLDVVQLLSSTWSQHKRSEH